LEDTEVKNNVTSVLARALLIGVLASVSLMGAPPTASVILTDPGSTIYEGYYVGPYSALINGVSTLALCDDFAAYTYVPELWTADVFTPAGYSGTANSASPGNDLAGYTLEQKYNMVGYLATQLLSATTPEAIGQYHFALWTVFDTSAIASISAGQQTVVAGLLSAADAYKDDASYISSFTIYSPNESFPVTCPGEPGGVCAFTPPQELMVKTPEPATVALLAMDLSGVGLLFAYIRRRRNK
jgi:hypothetical protein